MVVMDFPSSTARLSPPTSRVPTHPDGRNETDELLTVADDDKAGVAMGGDLLHKRLNRLWVVPADLLT